MDDDISDGTAALTVRVPVWPIPVITALAAGSAWLASVADSTVDDLVGWLVAVVAFGALLAYRRHAAAIGDDWRYERVAWVDVACLVLAGAVLLLFPLHAYPIAREVAEL